MRIEMIPLAFLCWCIYSKNFYHSFLIFLFELQKAEAGLDVFNVNVARHQAEVEIDRKGLTRLEDQPQGWVAWGKSWFGGGGGTGEQKKGNASDIASKFQVHRILSIWLI